MEKTQDCPVIKCGCHYHAEDGTLCDYAKDVLKRAEECRFTLTNAMGAQCDTHGILCPRRVLVGVPSN